MRLDTIAVQKRMLEKGMKNVDVARVTGVTPQAVSDWICGNTVPNWTNFGKLATSLDAEPNDLLILDDKHKYRGANGRGDESPI